MDEFKELLAEFRSAVYEYAHSDTPYAYDEMQQAQLNLYEYINMVLSSKVK